MRQLDVNCPPCGRLWRRSLRGFLRAGIGPWVAHKLLTNAAAYSSAAALANRSGLHLSVPSMPTTNMQR